LLAELGAALDAQDPYLDGHSRRVARYATMIARRMDLPDEQIDRVKAAAAIHDIGKLRVDPEVVYKPGRLTDAEFELMKRHAGEGGAMAECLGDPALAAAVRAHHERWDGSGYPDGAAGERIPLEARIISVADTFDALTSPRAYRPAAPHAKALGIIAEEAGEQLDPHVARAFISCYSDRRGAALWAGLASLPRQLAERLGSVPGELTSMLAAAVIAPLVVVAGATASAALPVSSDTPAPDPVAVTAPATSTPRPAATPQAAARPPAASETPVSATATAPAATPTTGAAGAQAPPAQSATPIASARAEPQSAPPTPTPTASALVSDPIPALLPSPVPTATPPSPQPEPTPTAPPSPEPTPTGTPTTTPSPRPPHTAEDCKDGGWITLGYPNQGQCIADAKG
jgi:hypothetical protein